MKKITSDGITSCLIVELKTWYENQSASLGHWPSRRDVRPHHFSPDVMVRLILSEVHLDPFRVKFRLVGSVVEESFGFAVSGKWLDELPLAQKEDLKKWYKMALTYSEPIFSKSIKTSDGQTIDYEGACFPLGNLTDNPRCFLLCEHFLSDHTWREVVRNRQYSLTDHWYK